MPQLTEEQRISLLMMCGWRDHRRSLSQVVRLFNTTFPGLNISKSTVSCTLKRFEDTGTTKNRAKSGRPQLSFEKKMDIVQSFVEKPHSSTRQVGLQHEVDNKTVWNLMKKENKWHPYKIHLVQKLAEDDFDRRLEFCEILAEKVLQNPQFLKKTTFSDEATFQLDGNVNRQNMRYWAESNPFWMRDSHTQYPAKLNVWAGIVNGKLIGPFFIDGNLNGVKYLEMLRTQIVPAIYAAVDGDMDHVWFQQDGCSSHYALAVRGFLDRTFPDRWIGRRGPMEWPARSPDLTTLDFFLWGYLKNRVYATDPVTIEELRRRIEYECSLITKEVLERATEEVYSRAMMCQEHGGHQFEHYYK